jgi:hypothetical protein
MAFSGSLFICPENWGTFIPEGAPLCGGGKVLLPKLVHGGC